MMFAYNTSPVYFFDALSNLQQLQLQQYREQLEAQKPKIIKKVETEEGFQIQIHKNSGNFQSYEVRAIRAYGNPNLVNLIIESKADEFSKVFQFSLDDIELSEIDWEYFERENILVLNVPKKVKFCTDDFANSILCSLLGVSNRTNGCKSHGEGKRHLKEQRKEQRRLEKRAKRAEIEANREAQREAARLHALTLAEEARRIEQRKIEEQERAKRAREAELKQEEQRRLAALRKAEETRKAEEARKAEVARIAEENRKAVEARKAAETRRLEQIKKIEEARKLEAEAQKKEQVKQRLEQEQLIKQQQEFLNQLFGGFFPGGAAPLFKVAGQPVPVPVPVPAEASKPSSMSPQPKQKEFQEPVSKPNVTMEEADTKDADYENESDSDDVATDTESIRSDTDSPPTPSKETLHRHPSLEEVEDEEFVMFRKKFGEQK